MSEIRMTEAAELLDKVAGGGYCSGCGACAAHSNGPLRMQLTVDGCFLPKVVPPERITADHPDLLRICPFAQQGPHENELSEQLCPGGTHDPHLGNYLDTYAGFVREGSYRERGSSGGLVTWILVELMRRGEIDAAIHVHSRGETEAGPLFHYDISRSPDEIRRAAKSRYYPVEMSGVLAQVHKTPGRYALVGVPCFIKAARRLAAADPVFGERLRFFVGLFCGHLKSTAFAEAYALECGLRKDELESIDFRDKNPASSAADYSVSIWGRKNGKCVQITKRNRDFFCSDWGQGLFKLTACDYCDDVVGETADVSIGDAWLPEYVRDGNGTNLLVVRHPLVGELLRAGNNAGRLELEDVSPGRIFESQAGAFRHRREGLAYRLHLMDRARHWRPPKRVNPMVGHLTAEREKVYRLRMLLASQSHLEFQQAAEAGDFRRFRRAMAPLVRAYRAAIETRLVFRVARQCKSFGIRLSSLLSRPAETQTN